MSLFSLIFYSLLAIHVASGSTALCGALGAIASAKGQAVHRLCGKGFFYGMTGVFFTAIPLSILIENLFLFLISLFSYYMALTGWRYAHNRSGVATRFDWMISLMMLIAAVGMMLAGWHDYDSHHMKAVVLLVFGVIGINFAISDVRTYRRRDAVGKERIVKHLSGMLGATIAAITAFLVTNFTMQPAIVLWLGPTVVITPIIIWWTYKVKRGNF